MNLQDSAIKGTRREELFFVNFNQDSSCLSVGTNEGFNIYNVGDQQFSKAYSQSEGGGIGIAEMLFCTSLVAVVGSGGQPTLSPRKLLIKNTSTQKTICELNFVSTILAVKMNRKRMIVVMETKIHVYDIATMKILHTIDTATNNAGLCSLCPGDNSYVAYPGTKGDVLIYDALNLTAVNVVEHAHKGAISCLTFNDDGSLLATASDKGTVIRIFSVPDATKVYEFRRGTYPARIYCMAFSIDSSLLCASSESGTIHVFKVDKTNMIPTGNGAMGGSTSFFSAYLPEVVSSVWQPARAFAQVRLPCQNCPSLCAVSPTSDTIMAVTAEGFFYVYRLDREMGGECKMISDHTLFESQSEEVGASYLE